MEKIQMKKILLLVALPLLLCACGQSEEKTKQPDLRVNVYSDYWQYCTQEQAQEMTKATDAETMLKAANCWGYLAHQGEDKLDRYERAINGRDLALKVAEAEPDNADAHYLAAYLNGLGAKNNPWEALGLVKLLEKEALRTIELDPTLNKAGPHRMLGSLYLKAPGSPVSVGDYEKSLEQFEKAMAIAPDYYKNRIGYAQSLVANDKFDKGCAELEAVVKDLPPEDQVDPDLLEDITLVKEQCAANK